MYQLLHLLSSGTVGGTLCPGQQVSYSCSASTLLWTGSAFSGMCPPADSITLDAAGSQVGDTLSCGVFNANVTDIRPGLISGRVIDSNLIFTVDATSLTNGSDITCQNNIGTVERFTINIQGE